MHMYTSVVNVTYAMNPKLPLDGRIYTLTVSKLLMIVLFETRVQTQQHFTRAVYNQRVGRLSM